MANVHRVYIKGRVPYDIVQRGSNSMRDHFAMMSSPCWGLRIRYGKTSTKLVVDTGGRYTYYEFEITGEEAIWEDKIEQFVKDLKDAGAEILIANVEDIENWDYIKDHNILNRISE